MQFYLERKYFFILRYLAYKVRQSDNAFETENNWLSEKYMNSCRSDMRNLRE
jgi:hypothetical protein